MRYIAYEKYNESSLEWAGPIPAHWQVKKIGHLALLKSGENIVSEEIAEGGDYPVFGGNGFRGYFNQYTHDGKFVLIGRQGALCGNINYASGKFWASEHALVAHSLTDFDVRWFGETLRAMNLNQYSVSAAQPGLAASAIAALRLPFPPIKEQQTIARFLDAKTAQIDELIAKKRLLIDKLKEKRQALIARTVTRGLPPEAAKAAGLEPNPEMRESGVEWLGPVPTAWNVIPLKWRARCSSGDGIPTEDVESNETTDSKTPVIGGNGLMGYTAGSNIDHQVLVIGRVGALCGNIHIVNPPAWITDNALILRPKTGVFDNRYLAHVLRFRNLNEIAAKTAQPLITGSQVRDQRIPCPPIPEQLAIAEFLESECLKLDGLASTTETAITRLTEYRQALITSAVTGRIDVRGLA